MHVASKGFGSGRSGQNGGAYLESAAQEPAPLRMVLGSQALEATITRLKARIADYETQWELAASTDVTEKA